MTRFKYNSLSSCQATSTTYGLVKEKSLIIFGLSGCVSQSCKQNGDTFESHKCGKKYATRFKKGAGYQKIFTTSDKCSFKEDIEIETQYPVCGKRSAPGQYEKHECINGNMTITQYGFDDSRCLGEGTKTYIPYAEGICVVGSPKSYTYMGCTTSPYSSANTYFKGGLSLMIFFVALILN